MKLLQIPLSTLALFAGAVTLALVANFLVYMMVGEVNRKLPEDQQLAYVIWYPGKLDKLKRLYRQFYPEGRIVSLFHASILLSGVSLLAFALKLGFFR